MTDRATRQAILEAIRADVRARVDQIMDRFVCEAHAVAPHAGGEFIDQALKEVSEILAEGITAQIKEADPRRPDESAR